jgi:ABC-type dipeptide/oligopeptide/nickel transport system permease component
VRQYSAADYVLTVLGFLGMCVPQFILALVLMLLAREWFGLTVMGLFSSEHALQPGWNGAKVIDLLQHIWLPIVIVGAGGTAGMIRVMRANLLDELGKPYVTTARARGVRPLKLLFKYPFRMALNPFVSAIGHLFPSLLSGSAIVAVILSLPTTEPLLLDAVLFEDTYMAGSLLLLLSTLSVVGVLVSDLLLLWLDPRIRMEGGTR